MHMYCGLQRQQWEMIVNIIFCMFVNVFEIDLDMNIIVGIGVMSLVIQIIAF